MHLVPGALRGARDFTLLVGHGICVIGFGWAAERGIEPARKHSAKKIMLHPRWAQHASVFKGPVST